MLHDDDLFAAPPHACPIVLPSKRKSLHNRVHGQDELFAPDRQWKLSACQSRPESRGSIHITSTDFRDHPEIKANYLSTELDRRTMVDGMKLLLQVFQSEALAGSITSRLSPAAEMGDLDDDALLEYIRQEASTVYHPTSTCSIGKVVDENLLVKGLDGLSVVDASVMPYVVSGNTNAATIMVAEKNADFLATRAK